MDSRSKTPSQAFTLTELLVTVAILTILTTILFISITRAKASTRQAHCLNNLRQHGLALANFLTENSVYPFVANPEHKTGGFPEHGKFFMHALARSGLGPIPVGSTEPTVYDCPSALQINRNVEIMRAGLSSSYGYDAFGLEGRTFGLAGLGGSMDESSKNITPVKEAQVICPSQMISMGDGVRGWREKYQDFVAFFERTRTTQKTDGSTLRVTRRHGKKLSVLFCDGHVETWSLDRLFKDTDATALRSWNRDHLAHAERLQ